MNDSDGDHTDQERTIVGGRPKGEGKPSREIPRGIELMLKIAAIDPTFRQRLIHMRGTASQTIGFKLAFSEAMILEAAPEDQLQAMIDAMPVSDEERDALRSLAPESRLAPDSPLLATMGIRPEWTERPPRTFQTRGLGADLPEVRRRPRGKDHQADED